jgi:hypothetical protein
VDEKTTDHQHVFALTLGGNPCQEPMPWTMFCRECGYTERGDDARTQLGISWSGKSRGDSDTTA